MSIGQRNWKLHVYIKCTLCYYITSVRYVHVMADFELFKALLEIFSELSPLTVMKYDLNYNPNFPFADSFAHVALNWIINTAWPT